jgi:hypothetical protein
MAYSRDYLHFGLENARETGISEGNRPQFAFRKGFA